MSRTSTLLKNVAGAEKSGLWTDQHKWAFLISSEIFTELSQKPVDSYITVTTCLCLSFFPIILNNSKKKKKHKMVQIHRKHKLKI